MKGTKDEISLAAFKLFLENGYRSTTYAELIKTAGLSKGAFYHYFKSKEELFIEVIDRYFAAVFERVHWSEVEKVEPSAREAMMRDYYLGFVRRISSLSDKGLSRYFILFFEAMEIYPEFRQKARSFYRRLRTSFETAGSGDGQGALDRIAVYEGYLFWMAVFPEDPPEELFK